MDFNPWEVILLLLATTGPLKVTIVGASLMAGAPQEFVNRVATRSVLTASAVCLVFVLLGEVILGVFKVRVPAFEIAGGVIVLLFSIKMVADDKAKNSDPAEPCRDLQRSLDIAVSPLAIPLMASVSGLVAIVSALAQNNNLTTVLFLSTVIVAIMALNYVCLRFSAPIVRALGPQFFQVVGKIMGVLLAALAVELMLSGFVRLGLVAPV
ncbi:MAG: MarC family protein [Pirellulales bacterium]|nr:MarC family protein [Pirellulales bacterium]